MDNIKAPQCPYCGSEDYEVVDDSYEVLDFDEARDEMWEHKCSNCGGIYQYGITYIAVRSWVEGFAEYRKKETFNNY